MRNLSAEEQKLIAECQWESFMYRAFPLGLIFGTAVNVGVRAGKIATGRFGSLPKVFAAGTLGYVLGKASYTSVCRHKILERAPHSNLARALRAASGIPDLDGGDYVTALAPGNVPATVQQQQQPDNYSDYFASPETASVDSERREGTLSYDMLRSQHRQRQTMPPPPSPHSPDQGYMPLNTPPPPPPPPSQRPPTGATNKYGDEGFE